MVRKNGAFYYNMTEGSGSHTLTCSLDGLERDEYTARWIVPEKPNGEIHPDVSRNGNTLEFHAVYQGQAGNYICNIGGINASVVVDIMNAPTTAGNYYTSYYNRSRLDQVSSLVHSLM